MHKGALLRNNKLYYKADADPGWSYLTMGPRFPEVFFADEELPYRGYQSILFGYSQ
jgi:hypothetical protein